jgi:hypothetical protein
LPRNHRVTATEEVAGGEEADDRYRKENRSDTLHVMVNGIGLIGIHRRRKKIN